MKKIRVGVIGLRMGRNHVADYQAHPAAEVVSITDLDADRLQEIGESYGVAARYRSWERMLEAEELDVVSIAVPNTLHKPLAIAAMEAGCDVLCEKPMAMNACEAREMLSASQRLGRRLMINFSYRFSEQSLSLKRQVEAGVLGDIYFARTVWHRRRGVPWFGRWFSQKALSGGGPLIDLGVHRLDLALWLMGYPRPVWVMASTYDHLGTALAEERGVPYDVEDLAVALVRFENGATLELEASWAANISEREVMITRLYGTKGGLVQRNVDQTYKFEAELYVETGASQFDMKLCPGGSKVPGAMYHFVDAIEKGIPHGATGQEGLVVMEILDAIYRSAEEGRPLNIDEPGGEGR